MSSVYEGMESRNTGSASPPGRWGFNHETLAAWNLAVSRKHLLMLICVCLSVCLYVCSRAIVYCVRYLCNVITFDYESTK